MNRKETLILLAIFIALFTSLCIAGIAIYHLYSDGFFNTFLTEPNQQHAETILEEPTPEPARTTNDRKNYLNTLQDEIQTCSMSFVELSEINKMFIEDPSLYNDADAAEEYKLGILQIKESCTTFGLEGNSLPELEEIKKEAQSANEQAEIFTDNYIRYIDTQEVKYGRAGITAAHNLMDHMDNMSILIEALETLE
jgi:hypothetical protein